MVKNPINKIASKQTQKILSDNQDLKELVDSKGWLVAKKKLYDYIFALESLSNIDLTKTPEEIAKEVIIKFTIKDILLKWVADVEGSVEQTQEFTRIEKESFEYSFVKGVD